MAADLTRTFAGKHFEKLILAAALLIFAVSLALFVAMRSRAEKEKVRTDVEKVVKEIQDARKAPGLDAALTPEERAALGIGQPPLTEADFAKRLNALPEAWVAKVDKWTEGAVGGPPPPPPLSRVAPQVMAVTDLQVFKGRGTTAEAVPAALFRLEGKAALSDIAWAGIVGQFDLTVQQDAYIKAEAPDPNYILLSRLELQRRELKPDGTWSAWQDVRPALAAAVAAKWPKLPANPRDKAAAGAWYTACKTLQADIRRMPLPKLEAEDKEGQTAAQVVGTVTGVEQPKPRVKEEPVAGVRPAPDVAQPPSAVPAAPDSAPAVAQPPLTVPATGMSPWEQHVVQPAERTATGPAEAAAPKHVTTTLWAYDAAVEPGKTYQYQVRVGVVSPIYSLADVKDDQVRWSLEFLGPWSKPSPEVTIPGLVEFFFIGTSGERANVELRRWILGQWVMQPSVSISFGAPIVYSKRQKLALPAAKEGAKESTTAEAITVDMNPQAFAVDVIRNFPYLPEGGRQAIRTNVLVYTDAKGQLQRRIDWDDKNLARNAREVRKEARPAGPEVKPPPPPPPPPPSKKERPPPRTPPR
jgi:hypothetical protein